MEFCQPKTSKERECLSGLTGAILCAVARILAAAPCRDRTDCRGGVSGSGFVRAVRDSISLLGDAEGEFRQRLISVLCQLEIPVERMWSSNRLYFDLQSDAYEDTVEKWLVIHEQTRTVKLVAHVMALCPARDFCDYIAGSFPSAVVDQINFTLYREVLLRACTKARLTNVEGRKSILLQLTETDPVITI